MKQTSESLNSKRRRIELTTASLARTLTLRCKRRFPSISYLATPFHMAHPNRLAFSPIAGHFASIPLHVSSSSVATQAPPSIAPTSLYASTDRVSSTRNASLNRSQPFASVRFASKTSQSAAPTRTTRLRSEGSTAAMPSWHSRKGQTALRLLCSKSFSPVCSVRSVESAAKQSERTVGCTQYSVFVSEKRESRT